MLWHSHPCWPSALWSPCSCCHCQSLPHYPSSLHHEFQILSLWWMCLIAEARVTYLSPHCREIWGTMNRQHSQFLCCFLTWPPTKNLKEGSLPGWVRSLNTCWATKKNNKCPLWQSSANSCQLQIQRVEPGFLPKKLLERKNSRKWVLGLRNSCNLSGTSWNITTVSQEYTWVKGSDFWSLRVHT